MGWVGWTYVVDWVGLNLWVWQIIIIIIIKLSRKKYKYLYIKKTQLLVSM